MTPIVDVFSDLTKVSDLFKNVQTFIQSTKTTLTICVYVSIYTYMHVNEYAFSSSGNSDL